MNPSSWMTELNEFAQKEISDWGSSASDGTKLIDYSTPKRSKPNNASSVMYNRFSDAQGNVKAPAVNVRKILQAEGITRITAGHTPVDDHPLVATFGNSEVVLTDTSTSRGSRAPVILIEEIESR
jgi:hypothetical protein